MLQRTLDKLGSVVPLFLKQIAMGGPVTVTHPDATRYFITLDEAVSLLLSAVLEPHYSGLLVPEPGKARRIEELARSLIAEADATTEIPIVFTQLRPGDKLHECLMSNRESFLESTQQPLRVVLSPAVIETMLRHALEKIVESCEERDLEGLLQAMCTVVPEYHPGARLQSQAQPSGREIQ